MTASYFFGYGSLVNHSTHSYENAYPARLNGWRREWCHTSLRPIAFLTAAPDKSCAIDGLIAHVPGDDWGALDAREFAYTRVLSTANVTHPVIDPIEIAVYTTRHDIGVSADTRLPILLSYLDVVVQGYLQQFGEQGVADFFATTTGWDAPILHDRANPQYPRHRVLSKAETALVDQHLAALGAKFIS
ncbi:gamma-glutamylcyclotransferase family protein [Shimia sagamensis]|uniref:glutathione-specific gamma-glutamylcyclotransferase n=1 Tax=Shimia sagamensis TaxID=1566352 RepID=A0ABY1NZV2_9RHOB|nr:gamma-glutamylcyclotransferase family protein [Shimia sagamensis]SMP23010.1 ChaC-like protein [Shimia sagamensis]